MADIFSGEPVIEAPTGLTLNDLVGEGRKYQDPDQLAKAYAHIEGHSKTLERELAELRAAKDLEDARLKNQPPLKDGEQDPPRREDTPNPAPKSSPKDDEDFRSQIRDAVKELNEADRAQQNLNIVAERLSEIHGSAAGASEAIRKRADELGVSVEWLRESAGRSPEAFYATMGVPSQGRDRTTPTPSSDVRLDDRGNVRNFEYFDKLRKDDPKLYFSAGTQRAMMDEARKQGSDFYKR